MKNALTKVQKKIIGEPLFILFVNAMENIATNMKDIVQFEMIVIDLRVKEGENGK